VLVEEYVIQEGDTLTVIADMWFGDGRRWPAVLAANEGIDPVRLRVGQTIKLPPRDATAGAAATGPRPAPAAAPTAGRTVDAAGYLVQEGDTLYSIARARLGDGTRWEEIYDANRAVIGEDPRRLKVGTRLSLPN
jgi:nucleoid-associated protein YgaU